MKKLLLLFLIGVTCTVSAQQIYKKIPLEELSGEVMSPEELKIFGYEKKSSPYYLSSEAVRVSPGWVNVSKEQVTAGSGNLTPNIFFVIYPDTTVKQVFTSGDLSTIVWGGYGQTINFNNEALSATSDFQFITKKDTVNVQKIRLNYAYIKSKTVTKSDSLFVSYGAVPRDGRAPWVGRLLSVSASATNPKATGWIHPKATGGDSPHGFRKVVTSTDIPGLKTEAIALVDGASNSEINVNTKLINDSLFFYYVTYKPAEFAKVNDTIFDWTSTAARTRAKYSSFRFSTFTEATAPRKRYFDDLTLSNDATTPLSYTTNFVQDKEVRYGLNRTIGTTAKVNYLNVFNDVGINTEFYVSGNTSLSTNEKLAPRFAMAPNPANNRLSINFKEVGQKSIEIIDMVGRIISQYTTNNANNFSTSDISSLPNGFYFVKITNDLGISATKKLIVSHL